MPEDRSDLQFVAETAVKLDRLETAFVGLERRCLEAIESLSPVGERLDGVEVDVSGIRYDIGKLADRIQTAEDAGYQAFWKDMSRSIDVVKVEMEGLRDRLKVIEQRSDWPGVVKIAAWVAIVAILLWPALKG